MAMTLTQEILTAYLQALLSGRLYTDFLSDDVALTSMNSGEKIRGRAAVEQQLNASHTHAQELKLISSIIGEGKAAAEAEFVAKDGSITPYSVVYDLADGKITALRIYFATSAP